MADLSAVAKEVFQVLQSYDYTMLAYDDKGMTVIEPADARYLMCYPKNLMVTLVDDDDNSHIALDFGKSVHIEDVMGLDQTLRTLATKYNMIFRAQQSGEEITPKNFAKLAPIKEDTGMHVCEGMYGTSRSSYLRMENARMIVRHSRRIDDSKIGARGRCIEAVLVENDLGERNRMPTNNLMAGRAMTQHVNQGGGFADPVGQQISGMAMQYSNLGAGMQAAVSESAMVVREACRTKLGKLRKTFERLYRPNSYAAEAEQLTGTVLTEMTIDETRIIELRQLLNGDLSDSVYECCCKALDEMKAPITEAPRREEDVPMAHPMGVKVPQAVWQAFVKDYELPMTGSAALDVLSGRFRAKGPLDAWNALAFKLGQIATVVKDHGLANLFDRVAEAMPEETDKDRRKKFQAIALHALRAATNTETAPWFEPLADKNSVVSEHLAWLGRFDPDRILLEVAWSSMDPSFASGPYEQAGDRAITDFDPHYFIESPEMLDIIDGRDPESEENHLGRDEVMTALADYLRHYIDSNYPEQISAFDDTSDLASSVYPRVVTALQERGFVVDDVALSEDDDLTIEDVLLPKHNQGDDLLTDVTKADTTDPDDPDEHRPVDPSYTSRLMTLAGMNVGSGGQSGPGY